MKDNDLATRAILFTGIMELLIACIGKDISSKTPAKPKWKFDLSDGDFRRRKEWKVYGFLSVVLPDGRSGNIVAGMSGPAPFQYAFDGSRRVLAEGVEVGDLPSVQGDLVDDLIGQLGLARRFRF